MKPKPSVHDRDVCAPDELSLPDGMHNETRIAEWWARVKLYVKAMDGVNRFTLLSRDGEGNWYLSSIEETK